MPTDTTWLQYMYTINFCGLMNVRKQPPCLLSEFEVEIGPRIFLAVQLCLLQHSSLAGAHLSFLESADGQLKSSPDGFQHL
jgi:hypothetical protein